MTNRLTSRHAGRFAMVLGLLLIATGCGSGSFSTDGRGYITGDGVVDQIAVANRVKLPTITGATLQGGTVDTRDLLGKVVVINLWGSWCAPCRAEAPALRKVSDETKSRGVQFIGIDIRDNDAAGLAFENEFQITYPSIASADSTKALLAFGLALPRNAIPSTLIIDQNGRVAARIVGRTTYLTLLDLVEATLAETSTKQGPTPGS